MIAADGCHEAYHDLGVHAPDPARHLPTGPTMTTTPLFQLPGLAARTTSLGQLLDHIEDPDRRQLAHQLLTEITAAATVPHHEQRVTAVLDLIEAHRRLRNVRECAGCDWRPANPGYASDPEATLRRHQQFNRHLAELIVGAVG